MVPYGYYLIYIIQILSLYTHKTESSMATPAVWGPHLWKSIHYIALGYPAEKPSESDKANYKAFYMNLHKVVPCIKCAENYQRHLSEVPAIDGYLGSSARLFEWTWMLHNVVNRDLGKREISLEAARRAYMSAAGITGTVSREQMTVWTIAAVALLIVVAAIIFWWKKRGAK